jgi:hypothetical protein
LTSEYIFITQKTIIAVRKNREINTNNLGEFTKQDIAVRRVAWVRQPVKFKDSGSVDRMVMGVW